MDPEIQTPSKPTSDQLPPEINKIVEDAIAKEVSGRAKPHKQRHFLAAFFFSFIFGVFGVDRFYLGKIWTGILKLITFGGLGVWAMIDLSLIVSGSMRDKQGNKLKDAEEYKSFAKKTLGIFTLVSIIVIALIVALSIYLAIQFMQGGGMEGLLKQFLPEGLLPNNGQLQDILNNANVK